MKKLLVLLFSILISLNSYGQLVKVTEDNNGGVYYIYTDTIKEHDGYIYWWELSDFLTPFSSEYISAKAYKKGVCEIKVQNLLYIYYYESMGKGKSENYRPDNPKWNYPSPDSINEGLMSFACDYVK